MGRDSLDRYWTPRWAIRALLDRLDLEEGTRVLEPCAGRELRIANVLRDAGHQVVTGDLDETASTHFRWDFPTEVALRRDQVCEAVGDIDWVITNPPYKTLGGTTAASIIEAALAVCPRVAVLLRTAWAEVCEDREHLFMTSPPTHQIWLPRVAYDGPAISEGSDGGPYGSAWYLWWPDTPGDLPAISAVPISERERRPKSDMEWAAPLPTQGKLL